MRIAKEIVPVVLRRPILAKVGLAASFVTVFNANAWCVGSGDIIDDLFSELLDADLSAEPSGDGAIAEQSGDDEANSDASDEAVDDEAESSAYVPTALQLGNPATLDFFGTGTVVAIGATKEVSEGIIKDGASFDSLALPAEKVLFKFTKRERVAGRGPARYKSVETLRPVFADALTLLVPATTRGSADEEEESSTAFGEMAEAAANPRAFTHGLTGPELAAHERKRKVLRLKTAPVRGHNTQGRTTKEPAIAPDARIAAFPDQSLCVESGKLFCAACHFFPSTRASSLKTHLGSKEHQLKLQKNVEALKVDDTIRGLVTRFFEENHVEGATLPTDTHVYRWRVMESMMYAGIPPAKIDMLRHLLEREGHPLTGANHLKMTFIPLIEERETKNIVKELMGQHFALIFDGTTRLGEAINMVTRSITNNFEILMRLVAFKTTKVHTTGEQLCRLILKTLQRDLGIDLDYCVAYARDSCSTNGTAVAGLLPHSVNAVSMLCFPHTLHNTGKHLNLPVLDEFMTPWLQLVAQPGAARLRWKAILGVPVVSFSKVRWWSRWEIMNQIGMNFGSVPDFLAGLDADDIGDATTRKMLEVLTNQRAELELELAAVMSCERLCIATYRLEGDRLELLLVYRTIEALRLFGADLGKDSSDLPSVAALLRKRHTIAVGTKILEWYPAPDSKWFTGKVVRKPTAAAPTYKITYSDATSVEYSETEVRNWIDVLGFAEWQTAVNGVRQAYTYLENRLTNNCQTPYHCAAAYEICRVSQLFDPSFAAVHLTTVFVDKLCDAVPALRGAAAALKAELVTYQVAARAAAALDHGDVKAFTEGVLVFWRKHGTEMPAWRKAAKIIFAIPPTSAASERVFSLLEAMFGKDQDSALSDLIQGALMLRYNDRTVG